MISHLLQLDPRVTSYRPLAVEGLGSFLAEQAAKGATFATIIALTKPSYTKTGCPYGDRLRKLARVNGVINWSYERAVNRALAKANAGEPVESPFVAQSRKWGQHDLQSANCLISHLASGDNQNQSPPKQYLRLKVQASLAHIYLEEIPGSVAPHTPRYVFLPDADVQPFLKRAKSPKEEVSGVIERDYSVDNLVSIVVNNHGYLLK